MIADAGGRFTLKIAPPAKAMTAFAGTRIVRCAA